jgi:hypothetical protein
MDFSKKRLDGEELLKALSTLTELPEKVILEELEFMMVDSEKRPEDLSLNELRGVLLSYLETIGEEIDRENPSRLFLGATQFEPLAYREYIEKNEQHSQFKEQIIEWNDKLLN